MKNFICLLKYVGLFLLISIPSLVSAQQYGRSAGIRLGATSGITFKSFIVNEQAVESIVSGRNDGLQLTVLWATHHPMEIGFNENFYFYYGVGGHVGLEKYGDINKKLDSSASSGFSYKSKKYIALGIDALIGIEYRMLNVPITLSMDMKPYLNYVGMRKLDGKFWDVAIAIKYIF